MKIKHINHVGIVVDDLADVKEFFIDLGFTETGGDMPVEGEWVERVVGLTNIKETVAMLQAPDGQLGLELMKFHRPLDTKGIQSAAANTLGLRHLAFEVENIDSVVDRLNTKKRKLIGEVQTYENSWRLCYVHGPEGIIIELAEQLNKGEQNE